MKWSVHGPIVRIGLPGVNRKRPPQRRCRWFRSRTCSGPTMTRKQWRCQHRTHATLEPGWRPILAPGLAEGGAVVVPLENRGLTAQPPSRGFRNEWLLFVRVGRVHALLRRPLDSSSGRVAGWLRSNGHYPALACGFVRAVSHSHRKKQLNRRSWRRSSRWRSERAKCQSTRR